MFATGWRNRCRPLEKPPTVKRTVLWSDCRQIVIMGRLRFVGLAMVTVLAPIVVIIGGSPAHADPPHLGDPCAVEGATTTAAERPRRSRLFLQGCRRGIRWVGRRLGSVAASAVDREAPTVGRAP